MSTQKFDLDSSHLSQFGFLTLISADRTETVEIKEFISIGRDPNCNIQIQDPFISQKHARIESTPEGFILRDLNSSNGVFVNGSQVHKAKLNDDDIIKIGENTLRFSSQRCQKENEIFTTSKNKVWSDKLLHVPLIAKTQFPVMINGSSGTGKEILARQIHRRSKRSRGPFVSINCSALSESLVESELFGHIKGSFTGATSNRKGAFQSANGGTLFLDEIGDLPLSLQPKLLRALENMEVKPVGSDRSYSTDARVISATHKNLKLAVAQGSFREDLYYRLNVIRLRTPSLSERIEDLENLLYYFCKEKQISFSAKAIKALKKHTWPGNIRELKNFVARSSALYPKQQIAEHQLNLILETSLTEAENRKKSFKATLPNIKKLEKEIICERLVANHGHQRRTAEDLDIPKSTLHDRIRAYNINIKELIG